MGGRWEADNSQDDREVIAIRAAIDAGVTHLDTAESYGKGHAEELLARAIEGYDRSKLIIATKVSAWNQTYDGLRRSADASLERLNTDYIDLYLLHRYPEPGTPIAETMRAMDHLVEQGIIKNIGVCNMSVNRFAETQKHTANKLVCNQLHYNVKFREVEQKGILKFCQDNDVLLSAWRPLQKGELSDAIILVELAKKYEKTPNQIAINWLISQQNVITIPKTSNLDHLDENLGAIGWTMDAVDVERIRTEFPDQQSVSDAVPLEYEADIEA